MEVTDWKNCMKRTEAKEIEPDKEMASSLIKASENKLTSAEELKLREQTAAAKISLIYDSVRELLEAMALRKGFKIYNHICYTAFLEEVINEKELAEDFDDLRKVRNDINYYGKEISLEEAKEVLDKLKILRKSLLKLI